MRPGLQRKLQVNLFLWYEARVYNNNDASYQGQPTSRGVQSKWPREGALYVWVESNTIDYDSRRDTATCKKYYMY